MELISVKTDRQPDIRFQDGGLRHAAGARSYQILRANRAFPEQADGFGWTYNHAPMLCWYAGRFYVEYISDPVSEHEAPGHTMLSSSADGIHWDKPRVAFEALRISLKDYKGPRTDPMPDSALTVPHQRMGFYAASNGAMLVLSFYGIVHDRALCSPCDGWGLGRAVRRLHPDGRLGDTFFFMYNTPAGFTKENTPYFPYYEDSGDPILVGACRELAGNRPVLSQMYEEQKRDKELFPVPLGKAPCFYTAGDGRVVTLFKMGLATVWEDGGQTFGPIRPCGIKTATGKVWGQKLPGGGYALFYNPTPDGQHRWPIALVTGEDGYHFSDMRALTGAFSPARYGGLDKNPGPQYMRGIAENNPQPPDGKVHLVYSVNKEDIWITHLSVPIEDESAPRVCERFEREIPPKWSVYAPSWTRVEALKNCLAIEDREPYDRALVERALKDSSKGTVTVDLSVDQLADCGEVSVELADEKGASAVQILFDCRGRLQVLSAGRPDAWTGYEAGRRLKLTLSFDCDANVFTARLNGGAEGRFRLNTACEKIVRLTLTTKAATRIPYADEHTSGKYGKKEDVLPESETPLPPIRFRLYAFSFAAEEA